MSRHPIYETGKGKEGLYVVLVIYSLRSQMFVVL
jgi:hypothetical protein